MHLFGYRIETRTTHFTLNDRKIRCKWISRFSLGGWGGGGGGGGGRMREASDMYQASES